MIRIGYSIYRYALLEKGIIDAETEIVPKAIMKSKFFGVLDRTFIEVVIKAELFKKLKEKHIELYNEIPKESDRLSIAHNRFIINRQIRQLYKRILNILSWTVLLGLTCISSFLIVLFKAV